MRHLIHVSVIRAGMRRAAAAVAFMAFFSTAFGLTLSWRDNSTDETGFRIERALADLVFVPLATVGQNVTSYVDATALPATVYHYRVVAVNAWATSAYSNVATFVPIDGNTAPTISKLGDQSINEDTSMAALSFTVGDAETPAGNLTVNATSSNPALVPVANMALGGTGASRTITISPPPNRSGSALITVTVSDGILSTSTSFTLTVNEINDPPTISAVPNQTTTVGTPLPVIAFSIGDVETPAANLSVSASSANSTLIPPANIVLGGTGTNRTVLISPAPGQTGITTFTLSVSDGELTRLSVFAVIVNPGNMAPTISNLIDQSIDEDTSTGLVTFTVGDAETPAGNLMVSATSSNPALVPSANLVLGGTGANRTITISPTPNQSGSAFVTVTVSDGILSTSTSFTLAVKPINDPPTISAVPNQITTAGTPLPVIGFSVGDVETPAANLSVSASSANSVLIPQSSIVLGGTGPNRTVLISPAAGQTGVTTLTLFVSDGELTRASSFAVTVNPGNTAPGISNIPDQMLRKGGTTGPIAFTIGDAETAAGSLTLTGSTSDAKLVPANAIVFGGSAGNRTVTVTPLDKRTGTATITVMVSDGTLVTTESFLVTVQTRAASVAAVEPESIDGEAVPNATELNPRLQLSALGSVSEGNPLIGGFVVEGEVARQVLVRGVGPGLAQFGVGHTVAAPQLQVYDAAGEPVQAGGAWGGDASVAEAMARTGRFPLAAESADAAMLLTLMPGIYTVHVTDGAGDGGTALLEILDAEGGAVSGVVAESARASIAPDRPLTTGLVVGGNVPKRILVRGIGPALAEWGVLDPLESPLVTVYDHTGRELARNVGGTPAFRPVSEMPSGEDGIASELASPDPGSLDVTPVLTLEPGIYTITLGSAIDSRGSGLIQVVELR